MLNPSEPAFIFAVALVAALFSSVGHGGASGYLALMSFTVLAGRPSSTLALTMNLAVSCLSFFAFHRAKHADVKIAAPFLTGSIPFAYLGGNIHIATEVHKVLIGVALAFAAIWMIVRIRHAEGPYRAVPLFAATSIGAFLGLLSGVVGIGGGVFLSPILVQFRICDIKKSAAIAALFIFANSLAGLLARASSELGVVSEHVSLLCAAITGALVGSLFGAFRATSPQLKIALSAILLLASAKLIFPR